MRMRMVVVNMQAYRNSSNKDDDTVGLGFTVNTCNPTQVTTDEDGELYPTLR